LLVLAVIAGVLLFTQAGFTSSRLARRALWATLAVVLLLLVLSLFVSQQEFVRLSSA